MKKPFFCMLLCLAVSAGCSKLELAGVSASRYQDLTEHYSSVMAEGNITLETSSSYDKVEITSDANVLPYVRVSVRNDALVIGYEENIRISSGHYETVVRIPADMEVRSVRIRSGAGFRSDGCLCTSSSVRFDAGSGSRFVLGGIEASDVLLNLVEGSSFVAGPVSVQNFSMNLTDGSAASMDGYIGYCDAILEDGSRLVPRTGPSADTGMLSIFRFNGTLSDGSSAVFYSDGLLTGSLSDGSSVIASGHADNALVER